MRNCLDLKVILLPLRMAANSSQTDQSGRGVSNGTGVCFELCSLHIAGWALVPIVLARPSSTLRLLVWVDGPPGVTVTAWACSDVGVVLQV